MKRALVKYSVSFGLTLLVFALVLGCFQITASAQTSGVGVSPLAVEVTVEKGAAYVNRYLVTNDTRAPVRVRCSLKDVWHEGGRRVEGEPGTLPRSASSWVRFSQAELVVQPRSTATIEAVISVPQAAAGSYYTMPVFDLSRAAAPASEGSAAGFNFRFQGRIVVTTAQGSEFSLKVDGAKVEPPTSSTPLMLSLDLANAGNAHVVPSVTFAILDQTGRLVGRGKFSPNKLMPSERATASGSWVGELPPGRYSAVSSVTYKTTSSPNTVIKEITFAVP